MENLIKPIYFVGCGVEIFRHIPKYNGYMVSNYGILISYKHYKMYPEGYRIKPNKKGLYTISNTRHDRITKPISYFIDPAFSETSCTALPSPNSYHCGFNRLKDIPDTKEERACKGYGIYDIIHSTITGESVDIDNDQDDTVTINFDFLGGL